MRLVISTNTLVRLFNQNKLTMNDAVWLNKHGYTFDVAGGEIVSCEPPLRVKNWLFAAQTYYDKKTEIKQPLASANVKSG